MLPPPPTVTLAGVKKRALVPVGEFTNPLVNAPPASVVTTPLGETARIMWFAVSATYATPAVL